MDKKTGVKFDSKRKRWIATICCNYEQIHLGSFISKEIAIKARKDAEMKYFGYYLKG